MSETLTFPIGLDTHVNVVGSYEKRHSAGVAETTAGALTGRLTWRPSNNLLWNGDATYRNSSVVGNSEREYEFNTDLTWSFRHAELRLYYRALQGWHEITGKERRQYFFLQIRRYFGQRKV